jgi:hypothetical protein
MSARKTMLAVLAPCLLALAALLPATASAEAKPAWTLTLTPLPANFEPGATPHPEYMAVATNVGAASTTTTSVLKAILPPGLEPVGVSGVHEPFRGEAKNLSCGIAGQVVTCETSEVITPGRWLFAQIEVEPSITAEGTTLTTEATISGGGATQQVSAATPTKVQAGPIPFDFLPGFHAPMNEEDGEPTTLAGSHPYQQTIAFGVPTVNPGDLLTNDGHPRNFYVELPRGMAGNLAASHTLCTEAELTTLKGCPNASQVGLADITTLVGGQGLNVVFTSPLYNMVPPPGQVAEFATNVANQGIYAHIELGVRSDGNYGIEAATHDVLALGIQPIFNVQAQIWGDPAGEAHDEIRGECLGRIGRCPVSDPGIGLLTMPGACPGGPLRFEVLADSWEEPSPPNELRETSYGSAKLDGAPVALEGCEELAFEPTVEVHPSTNLTDSASGLDVNVHQPQDIALHSRSTANLRDAVIHLPKGMTVNPSQASGLGACSQDQVGYEEVGGEGELLFSKEPQSCPDSAKIGSFEVTSPALVQRNAEHEVEEDLEGNPVPEPLHGSIYLAQPFQNPFGSLIATYLVVEDKQTGIVAKLGGEGELNRENGQITVRFTENPELPLEDIRAHIFGGSRGSFITPPACASATTEAQLTPWSTPAATVATSSFKPAATPLGGTCPATEAQMPNTPKLSAGTESPSAGKYSPLLFKLSREDGTQRIEKAEVTAPVGLIAKLAGVGICSEADIAKARSREAPQRGAEELADPSCPASSEIGSATAAAGAGPTPFRTQGKVYLAGPYKGAPVSMVAIAPAVAGPFDLGTVVVRSAIYLDPATAQARVVTDAIPTFLHGVAVDLRSIAVRLDRSQFTLNPTSCAEKSFAVNALSTLGQSAALTQRFQVGGCKSLPYKPKLTAKLFGPIHRGGHPRLEGTFLGKPGEANTKAISFTLPTSEFIDQAHFRTICTRVQFAANACPAGSIYGNVRVTSPLVDYPLEGPVYLRSSSHKLPDVVFALHGPAYQPVFLEADARVDSVKGGLRARFESVPDAPLTKAVLKMQGGKKGLFQNSTNICKGTHRATVLLDAQNGKVHDTMPALKAQCKAKKKTKGGGK